MKLKLKNCLLIVLFVLFAVSCGLSFKFMSKTAGAKTEENTEELKAFCGNAYETSVSTYSLNDNELVECLNYDDRTTHGNGRQNGGTDLLTVGCRNYKGRKDKLTYGTTDIPYWINMKEMNRIADTSVREQLINRIRVQAQMWNQSYMYDGTDWFINFYEVISIDGDKPSDISGIPVIEVLPYDYGYSNIEGEFSFENFTLKVGCDFSGTVLSSSIQVAAHEFGHVLGLAELDSQESKKHSVLMGYNQTVYNSNLETLIHYQDIQGAAVINAKHTCAESHYMRYKYKYNRYYHICFYCDRIFIDDYVKFGSKEIMAVCDENSHDYQPMVACGLMRWDKCTKCYKVVSVNLQTESDSNVYLSGYGYNEGTFFINMSSVNATYGNTMPQINFSAPDKDGYAFNGFCDANGKKYYEMQVLNDPVAAAANYQETYFVEKPVPVSGVKWYHNTKVSLYPVWEPLKCEYTYLNIADGEELSSTTVILTHGKNIISPILIDGYNFKYFEYYYKEYSSVPAEIDIRLYRSDGGGIVPKDSILTAYYEKKSSGGGSCLAAGSQITLADGSQVAVENLTGNEILLVWNLYTGSYDVAPILFIDKDPEQFYEVINLSFSDGTTVKVISEHGFWDYDLNKYVYLDADAADYIGHWFNKGDGRVQLIGVAIEEEYTSAWSPVTYGHLCYFVDGMLSMPGGIEGLFNIFDVDAETMKYDEVSMQADIETYGLFTYEEFIEYFYLPEEAFEAFNGQYLKVSIGKELISVEELASLYDRYSDFLA